MPQYTEILFIYESLIIEKCYRCTVKVFDTVERNRASKR